MAGAGLSAAATPPEAVIFTRAGVWRGAERHLMISAFVGVFGVAFGAAAVDAGLSAAEAMTMSSLVFAGASQFAALDLWGQPASYVALALVTFALNARFVIYGAALSPWVNVLPRGWRSLSLALMADGNFAYAYGEMRGGARDMGTLLGGGAAMWAAWVVGTAFGYVGGRLAGDLNVIGIDVVMPAFFVTLLAGQIKTRPEMGPVLAAALTAYATAPLIPDNWHVIVAALVGGVAGMLLRDR